MLTAVAALYALVLQAVLGGIAALPASSGHAILCLQQPDGASLDQPGSEPAPHHHATCCIAAPTVAAAVAPVAEITTIAWPQRAVAHLTWAIEPVFNARAPPGTRASPRAPPVA